MQESNVELGPLTVSQLLDRSVTIYRERFWTFLGITAVIQLPVAIIAVFLLVVVLGNTAEMFTALLDDPTTADPSANLAINQSSNLVNVINLFAVQFSNAAMSIVAISALFGREMTMGMAWRRVRPRLQTIGGMTLITFAISFAAIFIILLLFLTIVGWVGGLAALWLVVGVAIPLTSPIIMLEGRGAWDSIKRAWSMVRRNWWYSVRMIVGTSLFVQALQFGLQLLLIGGLGALIFDGMMNQLEQTGALSDSYLMIGVLTLGSTLVSILFLPITAIAINLFYLDLRSRHEGLDLWLAIRKDHDIFESLEQAPTEIDEPTLMSGPDFGNMMRLGCGGMTLILGVYIALVALIAGLVALAGI